MESDYLALIDRLDKVIEAQQRSIDDLKSALRAQRDIINLRQMRIDELMMEYCPDEMTEEQTANWAKYQRPVTLDLSDEETE